VTLACPRCAVELRHEQRFEGEFHVCDACKGCATSLSSDLPAKLPPPGAAPTSPAPGAAPAIACPRCRTAMRRVAMRAYKGVEEIDACESCGLVWFDTFELQRLSVRGDLDARPRSPAAREAAARFELTKHADNPAVVVERGSEEWLAGALGVPLAVDPPPSERRAWVSWIVAGAIVLLALAQQLGDPGLNENRPRPLWSDVVGTSVRPWSEVLGFVPADPLRHGGLTLLTGFLLHGGLVHALFNVYFLLLVGSVLEPVMGWWRFLLALVLCSLAGDLADVLVRWGSTVPLVGASGGISGLFGLCAFAAPRLRLGLTFGAWIHPAARHAVQLRLGVCWVLGLWLLGELIAMSGVFDRDVQLGYQPARVAYHVHVAGALAGLALVLLLRRVREVRVTG
jgi:membrane associated rhomboid family serine protease/Zn-finger nucleic acid-binding protein